MATRNTNTNSTRGYTEAFIRSFTTGYEHVLQEKKRQFAGMFREERLEGEYQSYDFIGTIELDDKGSRFEDIPVEDMLHNRRWISPVFARKAIFVDDEDQIAEHTDPKSAYIEGLAKGAIRKENAVCVAAFFADVSGGKTPGTDTYTLANSLYVTSTRNTTAGRTIAHDVQSDFTAGGVSTGLTVEKLILARQAMKELENDPDEQLYIGVSPKQTSDLLREAETQSIDTSLERSLVAGEITRYMGFEFVESNRFEIGSSNDVDADTNVFELPVWSKEGMLFARHESPIFDVGWVVRKGVWQISARVGMQAIRMDESKVLKIECI